MANKIEVPTEERLTVKVSTISPDIPKICAGCLSDEVNHKRQHNYRRSDGTVERVSVVYWNYCDPCFKELTSHDGSQRWMTAIGTLQMLVVIYIVGGALGKYDLFYSSFAVLIGLVFVFTYHAKNARALWAYEWARIEDVYKGGIGACYSFRNVKFAQAFADANQKNNDLEGTREPAEQEAAEQEE